MANLGLAPIINAEGYMMGKAEGSAATDYGVDPTLLEADDAILAWDVNVKPNAAIHRGTYLKPTAGKRDGFAGAKFSDVSFKTYLGGIGTVPGIGVHSPPWARMAQGCQYALAATGVAPNITVQTLTPVTQQVIGISLEFWFWSAVTGAQMVIVRGFMGELKIVIDPSNGAGICEFTGKGLYTIPASDAGIAANLYYYEPPPPPIVGLALTLGSDDFLLSSLEFTNNTVTREGLSIGPSGTHGYQYFLSRRNPELGVSGQFVTDGKKEAAESAPDIYPWYATPFIAQTPLALSAVMGSGAGKIITITTPVGGGLALDDIDPGNDGPVQTNTCPFTAMEVSGDDEISIAIT